MPAELPFQRTIGRCEMARASVGSLVSEQESERSRRSRVGPLQPRDLSESSERLHLQQYGWYRGWSSFISHPAEMDRSLRDLFFIQ